MCSLFLSLICDKELRVNLKFPKTNSNFSKTTTKLEKIGKTEKIKTSIEQYAF